jgi:hypothetical protein
MSKAYAIKRKDGQGYDVVGGGHIVYNVGRHGAEDIAAKRNKRLGKK